MVAEGDREKWCLQEFFFMPLELIRNDRVLGKKKKQQKKNWKWRRKSSLFLEAVGPGELVISSPPPSLPPSLQSLAACLRLRCSFSPRWLVNDVVKTRMKPVRGTL